ncbi:MAG: anti-sigma factor [Beijerinckiaceae bacterium]
MSADSPIGEDDLNAFVDGRLTPERHAIVSRFLADNPQAAEKVEADIAARTALRERLQFKAVEPIPSRLRIANLTAGGPGRTRHWARFAAAAILLLALGGLGGWFGHARLAPMLRSERPTIAAEALMAHRIFVAETLHPVEVAAAQEAHLVQWLSRRLNHPLKAPDLSAQGFHLMGGRLLSANEGAAAQLMYQDEGGARLTLYLRGGSDTGTTFRFVQSPNASAFIWTEDGLGYALAAQVDRTRLLSLAEAVYRQSGPNPRSVPPT